MPYDGTAERMTALLSGAIDMGVLNVASGRKHLEGGALQGFAIAANERSKHLPDMPTLKELGVDMEFALKRGIVAPKGTPPEVIEKWSQVFKAAAENPDLLKQLEAKGTVSHKKEHRTFYFYPTVKEEKVKKSAARELIENVFEGSVGGLVSYLLENEKVSSDELAEIRKLLDKKKTK